MLKVLSNNDAYELVKNSFTCLDAERVIFNKSYKSEPQKLNLKDCLYSKIADDIIAKEGSPAFDRSTMDGFAVIAKDTFGSSESIPALLKLSGNINMGQAATTDLNSGECMAIATGGMLPNIADSVVMKEYCEVHNDGTVEIQKAVSPGENVIFKYDDIKPNEVLIKSGQVLLPHHIGTLASLGITKINSYTHTNKETNSKKPKVGIISTGDELVEISKTPKLGEIRDVNSYVLQACLQACGCEPVLYGIVKDEYELLSNAVKKAMGECDCILISGGSSVGQRDNTVKVLEEHGEILFHGLSIKPGKPTILASLQNKDKQIAAFGLPGHPVASYYVFLELVTKHLCQN